LFKKLRALAFVAIGLLAMPALATEVQSDGLTLNSHVFIDNHFEFTEENQSPLTLIVIENTVTAVTLAQNRTMSSAIDDNSTQVLTFDNSVAKSLPMKRHEVGWRI
jgi:hypothetical protein